MLSSFLEKDMPILALSCDYLMHGILCTAALHRAYLDQDQQAKYELLAMQHQNAALVPFRNAISNITAENCNQVFTFSLLLILAHFVDLASPKPLFLPSAGTRLEKVANWILWHRQSYIILNHVERYILSGPLNSLLREKIRARALAESLTDDVNNQEADLQLIRKLLQFFESSPIAENSMTVSERNIYIRTTKQLLTLLNASSRTDDQIKRRAFASVWSTTVSTDFVQLLKESHPGAVAVTAHYCLLLRRCHSCWFLYHCAGFLLEAMGENSNSEWDPYFLALRRTLDNEEEPDTWSHCSSLDTWSHCLSMYI